MDEFPLRKRLVYEIVHATDMEIIDFRVEIIKNEIAEFEYREDVVEI